MTTFSVERFLTYCAKKQRGPAEKRRLAKRLAERQRKAGAAVPTPTPLAPPPKSPEQIRSVRVTRRAKRLRRRIRERQIMAGNSGLPELMRRSLAPHEAARRREQAAAQAAKAATCVVLPVSTTGGAQATEAIDSNCVRTVGGKNLLRREYAT